MPAEVKLQGVNITHPTAADRLAGVTKSTVDLGLWIGKAQALRRVPLTEDQLVAHLADCAVALKRIRGERR